MQGGFTKQDNMVFIHPVSPSWTAAAAPNMSLRSLTPTDKVRRQPIPIKGGPNIKQIHLTLVFSRRGSSAVQQQPERLGLDDLSQRIHVIFSLSSLPSNGRQIPLSKSKKYNGGGWR